MERDEIIKLIRDTVKESIAEAFVKHQNQVEDDFLNILNNEDLIKDINHVPLIGFVRSNELSSIKESILSLKESNSLLYNYMAKYEAFGDKCSEKDNIETIKNQMALLIKKLNDIGTVLSGH